MIIASFFDGDNNRDLMRKQHDVYPSAISLMIDICNAISGCAIPPPELDNREKWGKVNRCDHRDIQFAHDLLATAFRYKHDLRQLDSDFLATKFRLEFDFMPNEFHLNRVVSPETLWKHWLISELISWKESPSLVSHFLTIMTNGNEPVGRIAQGKICLEIMDRFPDVPWESSLKEVFKKGLVEDILTHRPGETRH